MLPNHDELVRAMAHRTSTDADRAARDRGFRRDLEDQSRTTSTSVPARPNEPDSRPCPPPCPERAHGALG